MYTLIKYKFQVNIILGAILILFYTGCTPNLDYENVSAINPTNVWTDKAMTTAYLSDIYANLMPGWNFSADNSDEAMNQNSTAMSSFCKGIDVTVSSLGIGLSYANIDKINFMLSKLPSVPSTVLSQTVNDQFAGQCLFWRAWTYWSYVQYVGGVPLIRKVQDVTDLQSLYVKRSPTSMCVDSILWDLDKAISLLPSKWTGTDYGRIDKCAALAFKGRVLLWYASPLFNKNNDPARWQKAYDANKAALDACKAAGYGLFTPYNKIWQTKGAANTEAIMFNNYYYPDHAYNMNTVLPWIMTQGNACRCLPTAWQVLAFPRMDGTALSIGTPTGLDTTKLRTDATYNASFFTDLVKNMDPRFYASVFVPGTPFPTAEKDFSNKSFWPVYGYNNNVMYDIGKVQGGNANVGYYGGFYPIKAVTPGSDRITSNQIGGNLKIEIRFAEVLMNLAECANELGAGGHDYNEALSLIAQLRQRAGITKGSGTYGYGLDTYGSQTSARDLIINERFAEFAQEGKRWIDLRRWKRFDILNTQKYMSQIFFMLNSSEPVIKIQTDFDWSKNIQTDAVRAKFHLEFIQNVTKNSVNVYNLPTNKWFYPIALNDLQKNFNNDPSMQNSGWDNGTFDPLN
jgi:starch-binding outer membrane protein, SusD/RagB family